MESNRVVRNYEIVAEFSLHNNLLIEADMDYQFEEPVPLVAAKIKAFRVMQQIIAGCLFLSFAYQVAAARWAGKGGDDARFNV